MTSSTFNRVRPQSQTELAIAQLERSRGFLNSLLATLSDEQLLRRAGGVGNHALWVIGHLAFADDSFVSAFRGEESELPEEHASLFGQGSQPIDDASGYPSKEELLGRLEASRDRLVRWAKSLEGDALWQESPESIRNLTPCAIDAVYTLAEHEFLHAGQLTTVRSSLGMKPLFG